MAVQGRFNGVSGAFQGVSGDIERHPKGWQRHFKLITECGNGIMEVSET